MPPIRQDRFRNQSIDELEGYFEYSGGMLATNELEAIVAELERRRTNRARLLRERIEGAIQLRGRRTDPHSENTDNGSHSAGEDDEEQHFNELDPRQTSAAAAEIARLRKELLDLSRRNRLIHFNHNAARGNRAIRIIDEECGTLFEAIHPDERTATVPAIELIALPRPPDEPADELTTVFQTALMAARIEDKTYLRQIKKIVDDEPDDAEAQERQAERELRDRVRRKIKMPSRTEARLCSVEYARSRGINTSPDLQGRGRAGTARKTAQWQTNLDEEALERRLTALDREARQMRDEFGVETLHLVFGCLEWSREKAAGSGQMETSFSPLVLLPVGLEKRVQQTRRNTRGQLLLDADQSPTGEPSLYRLVAGADDKPVVNLCLRELLRQDFKIELPEWDENSPDLVRYFAQVNRCVESKAGWRVRPFVTLAHLSFTRLPMWVDLDPRIPDKLPPQFHPVLAELLGGGGSGTADKLGDYEAQAEEPLVHGAPPLVLDSDASQFAAIRAALAGRNLVIQGPPGTGKSQTIANLIGAALHEGKTVLFVAEKQVALQVVQRRLAEAGLGEFLLELHSAKMTKAALIESLKERLKLRSSWFDETEDERLREEHAELAKALHAYAEKMNQVHGRTGWTVHDIFWQEIGARKRKLPPCMEEFAFDYEAAKTWNADDRAERLARIGAYLRNDAEWRAERVDGAHPWAWVQGDDLHVEEIEEVLRRVKRFAGDLSELRRECSAIPWLSAGISSLAELSRLAGSVTGLGERPVLENERRWALAMIRDLQVAVQETQLADESRRESTRVRLEIAPEIPGSFREAVAELNEFGECYAHIPKPKQGAPSDLRERLIHVEQTMVMCAEMSARLRRMSEAAGCGWVEDTLASARALLDFSRLVVACPPCLRERRHRLGEPWAVETLQRAMDEAVELMKERESLEGKLIGDWRAVSESEVRDVIGRYQAYLDKHWLIRWANSPPALVASFCGKLAKEDILPCLRRLADFKPAEIALRAHPATEFTDGLFRGIDSDLETLASVIEWVSAVREATPVTERWSAAMREALLATNCDSVAVAEAIRREGLDSMLDALVARGIEPFSTISEGGENAKREAAHLRPVVDRVARWAWSAPLNLDTVERLRTALRNGADAEITLQNRCAIAALVLPCDPAVDRDLEKMRDALERVEQTTCLDGFREGLLSVESGAKSWREFQEQAEKLSARVTACGDEISALTKCGAINPDAARNWRQRDVTELETLCSAALATPEALGTQARRNAGVVKLRELGVWEFIQTYEISREAEIDGEADAMQAEKMFGRVIIRQLSRQLISSQPALRRFRQESPAKARTRFAELDRRLKEQDRARLRALLLTRSIPYGNDRGRVGDLTERALLDHIASKTTFRQPMRDVVRRASQALQAMKPCFMMSPLSVAQFIERGAIKLFDLVIFDEASQILPADALCALLRAKQFVVVGDQMQLPPTTFGKKTVADEFALGDEADASAEEISESILEKAAARYPNREMLKWHYRSRDPSLIAFSNSEFYNNELILFPASHRKRTGSGVAWEPVPEGRYGNRTNEVEAARCAELAAAQMMRFPNRSLGIVALNLPQQECIEAALALLENTHEHVRAYRADWADKPESLFIKNLESVQGDERDTILISTVFGPAKEGGVFHQRFGPINSKAGHRRLNVLFTRAKHQVIVVSSITPEKIVVGESSHRGVGAFKRYLDYARSGSLIVSGNRTGRSTESPFEDAVREALSVAGYECEPQVGVSGYFIDLGLRSKISPERFLLGIECDGANYHSSRSARDRDRLRQEVLEGLGWKIHRIWSTDWYRDSSREMERMLEAIRICEREADTAAE